MRQNRHFNFISEQDYQFIKRVTRPMLGFKSFSGARTMIAGIEAMHMIRKRQMVCHRQNFVSSHPVLEPCSLISRPAKRLFSVQPH
jgi:transposase-like protein